MRNRSIIVSAGVACAAVLTGLTFLFADATTSCALAQSSSCAAACRAAHNDCRIATKGSPSCDAQFQACLQDCRKK
jgi:hypothetical protein